MEPFVSFIVTYHNESEAMLNACLQSIFSLPLAEGEAEIVVVDDGSDVPFRLNRQGVKVIRQAQSGLSVARNTGIDASRGTYIQFVDADDCLIPDAYGTVLGQMRSGKYDVVMFRHSPFNEPILRDGEPKVTNPLPLSGVREEVWDGSAFLQHRNLRAAAWGYAFRKETMGDLRFHPGLLHEDELFTPQLFLKASTLINLNVEAYFYRQHAGTITHSMSEESVQRRLDDIHFIANELHEMNNPLLERRIRQLTVDYLQKTFTLTWSLPELRRRVNQLRKEGLLPLPVRCYSMRYFLVSLFA